jgi:hypothetical protein
MLARLRHSWPVIVLAFVILLCLGTLFYAYTQLDSGMSWWGTPRLPLPAYAQNINRMYPSMGNSRIIEFETNRSAEEIQMFFRSELAKNGWERDCEYYANTSPSTDEKCSFGNLENVLFADAYTHPGSAADFYTTQVWIYKPGVKTSTPGRLFISISEARHFIPLGPTHTVGVYPTLPPAAYPYPAPQLTLPAYP